MGRFVYHGPRGEEVTTARAFGLDWVVGVPRDVDDPEVAARVASHPHFEAVDEATGEAGASDDAPAIPKRRGRPPKVRADDDAA